MTRKEIQSVLELRYDRDRWKKLITGLFSAPKVFARPLQFHLERKVEQKYVSAIAQLGEVDLTDGQTIGLFEVELIPGVADLARNKVAIRRTVDAHVHVSGQAGALICFYDPDKSVWRFSFYSRGYDDDLNLAERTHRKRYTYLLGEGEKCRTAAEQFEVLQKNQGKVSLKDLLEAFSVEKVSKAFFREYKEHYQDFVEHLTGKRMVKEKGKWVEKKVSGPSNKLTYVFNGNEKEARDFCKKLMGRLVFLYFLQKKRWLGASSASYEDGDLDFVANLFKTKGDKDFYQLVLVDLFFDTLNTVRTSDEYAMPDGTARKVPFLNGGLFDKDELDIQSIKHQLTFPPALFSNPAKAEDPDERGFLDFLNAYNFTVHEAGPEEQTLAVDPEMLGHIFENLLEDNKDKGAFYTPKEIVHYMCQESLTQYLKNYLTREVKGIPASELEDQLRRFLQHGVWAELSPYSGVLLKALRQVKVCDPAIGSGAFPMGILHEIFQAVEHIHDLSPDETESIWELTEWEPAEVKLRIIQHSIYGVDIERGAVDIARLRFWLSIIVDEPKPRTLPNLDYKIMVGNSLVGKLNGEVLEINWNVGAGSDRAKEMRSLIESLHERTELYFRDQPKAKKEKLAGEVRMLKIELLTKQLELNRDKFREKMTPTNKIGGLARGEQVKAAEEKIQLAAYEGTLGRLRSLMKQKDKQLDYFDWELDFPEVLNANVADDPGFDVVIGNPPYVKEYTNRAAFDGVRKSPYYKGKMDLWYLFACRGLDLLKKDDGVLTFIATNNWTTNSGASLLRDKLSRDGTIRSLVDFGPYMIFESAGIQTMILTSTRNALCPEYSFRLSRIVGRNPEFADVLKALSHEATTEVETLRPVIDRASMLGSLYTFSDGENAATLDAIARRGTQRLSAQEIAQGIVAPQDRVNRDALERLPNSCSIGEGIFVLSDAEKNALRLNARESALVKPYYTSEQMGRYAASPKNEDWIIYTDSSYADPASMRGLPNLKAHLDRFVKVITSSNAPYGLHRSRDRDFFEGERVLALRKCVEPTFTYVPFPAYVSQSFNIIRSARFKAKYLTGLLNSALAKFWFRHRGKMQGHNYQLDLEPLMGFPIYLPYGTAQMALIDLVSQRCSATNSDTASALESEIDVLVSKLYGLNWEQAKVVDQALKLSKEEYDAIELPKDDEPNGHAVNEPSATYIRDPGEIPFE